MFFPKQQYKYHVNGDSFSYLLKSDMFFESLNFQKTKKVKRDTIGDDLSDGRNF